VLVTVDDAYADFDEHGWPIFRRHGVPVVLFVPTAFPADPATAFWWDRLHAALRAAGRAGVDRISTPMLGPIELGTRSAAASERLRAHFKAMPHDAMTVALDELIAAIGRRTSGSPLTREVGRAILDWDALRRLAREGVALAPHGRSHAFLDRVDPTALAAEVAGSRRDLERETGSALPLFAYPSGQYDETAVAAVAAAGFAAAFTTRRGTNDLRSTDPLLLRRINVGGRSTVGLLRAQLAPTTVRLGTAVRRWQTPASEHSASRT
jgi:peptidoglycan/xylan/chitin deacetylase (PgdA/CDA1 family)